MATKHLSHAARGSQQPHWQGRQRRRYQRRVSEGGRHRRRYYRRKIPERKALGKGDRRRRGSRPRGRQTNGLSVLQLQFAVVATN